MMYGTALPLLFPVAFISFLVIYFMEVYMLFYVFKKPVSYDASLYKGVLALMQYVPLLSLGLSGWYLSNYQLLPRKDVIDDSCTPYKMEMMTTVDSPFIANHSWKDYITPTKIYCNAGPAIPIVAWFWVYFTYLMFRRPIRKCFKRYGVRKMWNFDEISEEFKPYFENMAQDQMNWSIEEESYNRKKFNYSCKSEFTYD